MILALRQGLTGGCRVVLNGGFVEIGWRGRWRGVEESYWGQFLSIFPSSPARESTQAFRNLCSSIIVQLCLKRPAGKQVPLQNTHILSSQCSCRARNGSLFLIADLSSSLIDLSLPMQTKGRRLLAWPGQSSTLVLSKIFCTNIFSRVSFSRGVIFEQGHYFARFYAYKHHICVFPSLLLRKNDIITLGMCFKKVEIFHDICR